jgi:hypothetical protein
VAVPQALIPHLAQTSTYLPSAILMRFPTADELDTAIGDKLNAADNALDLLGTHLRRLAGLTKNPEPLRLTEAPTHETIGVIWSLLADAELELDHMTNTVREIHALMAYVDEWRREPLQVTAVEAA